MVTSVETGSLVGNHLGHQNVTFVNYLVKIRKNIENTSVETGSLVGNHLGHQNVTFVNYLVKIRKNIENT